MFNGHWRRRLLKQLAPEGSYTRRVLDTKSRLRDLLDDPNVDDVEKSKYYRRLCWKLSRKSLRSRWERRGSEDGGKAQGEPIL